MLETLAPETNSQPHLCPESFEEAAASDLRVSMQRHIQHRHNAIAACALHKYMVPCAVQQRLLLAKIASVRLRLDQGDCGGGN